ncbi:MAG: hypothetical protein AB7K04_06970 [Pseudorhodoplanes sp.]
MRIAVIIVALALLSGSALFGADPQTATREVRVVPGSETFLAGVAKRMEMVEDVSPFTDTHVAASCFRAVLSAEPSPALNLKRKRVGPLIAFNPRQAKAFDECLAADGYRLASSKR